MAAGFATLNPDLLHLCLSHLETDASAYARAGYGRYVTRAGATCKHWRAVACTERLWRELCVKRWPSTAKLTRAPPSYLKFYKQRTLAHSHYSEPTIELSRLTLLFDGQFGGLGGRFSEVLSFADATRCVVRMSHGFEWAVPAFQSEYGIWFLDLDILRDDGKIASAGRFEVDESSRDGDASTQKYSWTSEALDLEKHAEFATRIRENWLYLHAEFADGKLKICASNGAADAPAANFELCHVLALLDWA